MTVLVKCESGLSYTLDNVVSINKILGTVIIQYIDKNNIPENVSYDETCNAQITALVM